MTDTSKVTGLQTRHVFLDTEVYRRYGHNLNDKVLQRLLQLTKDHICTLHIADITISEIESQLHQMAADVAQAVNKGNRLFKNFQSHRQQSASKPEPQNVDAAALTQDAISNFGYLMTVNWQPKKHEALKIPAKTVFDSYFRRDPPFDKPESKEFPDAFVVAALDAWCQKNHEKMYLVTKDKAMLRAVQMTTTLIPVATLEDYLALLVANPETVAKVGRILGSKAWDTVESSIPNQIGHLGTVYTGGYDDGEVISHELGNGSIELDEFDVISVSGDIVEVVAKIQVPIAFDVQYLDTTSAVWDSEDKEYIGGDKEVVTLNLDTLLTFLLVIDLGHKTIDEVDLLTRDVRVEEEYEDYK